MIVQILFGHWLCLQRWEGLWSGSCSLWKRLSWFRQPSWLSRLRIMKTLPHAWKHNGAEFLGVQWIQPTIISLWECDWGYKFSSRIMLNIDWKTNISKKKLQLIKDYQGKVNLEHLYHSPEILDKYLIASAINPACKVCL